MNISPTKSAVSNSAWFDEFIAGIRTHQLQLETDTATDELKGTYNVLMNGDDTEMAALAKMTANRHFIKAIIVDYLHEIASRLPTKLAFDLDDSEVLVWAEIKNDDEEMEDFLLLAEAAVNAKFHMYGYDLTSTIVEEMDELSIPNHYAIYKS